MSLARRLSVFAKSFNPRSYTNLCKELRTGRAILQFFFTFLLLFVIMVIILVPVLLFAADKMQERLNTFDEFELGGTFEADLPITLLSRPLVRVDFNNATLDKELVLLTKEGIEWRRWFFFGSASRSWDETNDVRELPPGFLFPLILFVTPAIAFWAGAILLIKYIILINLFGSLSLLAFRFTKVKVPFSDGFKVALLAATPMMLEMLLFPFYRAWWIAPIIYIIFLIIGLYFVGKSGWNGPSEYLVNYPPHPLRAR